MRVAVRNADAKPCKVGGVIHPFLTVESGERVGPCACKPLAIDPAELVGKSERTFGEIMRSWGELVPVDELPPGTDYVRWPRATV